MGGFCKQFKNPADVKQTISKMDSGNYTVGVRLHKMGFDEQALVLARIAQARLPDGQFTPRQIEELFISFTLPKPAKISNVVAKLRKGGLLTQGNKNGTWRMTPLGRQASFDCLSDLDLARCPSDIFVFISVSSLCAIFCFLST